ncbi:hypothetical protein BJ742DRAFT_475852 [Cladochytrium replicatum]|nr:hypothetical protein BJ742DRAFT_475852 [Cladochytrium replicatum]
MDNNNLIEQFVAVTSASDTDARKFLESEHWDLQEALTAFYDVGATPLQLPAQSSSSAQSVPAASSSRPIASTSRPSGSRGAPRNVRTFSELANADSNSEDDGEDYFAGGEKSGILMKGGAGKKPEPSDLVKQILEKASKAGPPPEDFEKKEKKKPAFIGSGYRLGSEDEPPAQTPQASSSSSARVPATPAGQDMEVVERQLTFWRNGFSIDDGPLMSHDDPQARQFLEAINSGRAPPQLLNVAYGQPVEIKVAHRMEEDYKPPPKKPLKAFSGGGQRLGAPIPGETVSAPAVSSIPGSFPGSAPAAAIESLGPVVVVDESVPVTSIQVRLADGSRAVYKFNDTHTVGDIRNQINRNRPGDADRNYALMTTFPNRELTDSSATIKDAGLVNAVIVQKYN